MSTIPREHDPNEMPDFDPNAESRPEELDPADFLRDEDADDEDGEEGSR